MASLVIFNQEAFFLAVIEKKNSNRASIVIALIFVQRTQRTALDLGKVDLAQAETYLASYPVGWAIEGDNLVMGFCADVSTAGIANCSVKYSAHYKYVALYLFIGCDLAATRPSPLLDTWCWRAWLTLTW